MRKRSEQALALAKAEAAVGGAVRADASREAALRTGILVLGMHRSGTSALARVLSLLGFDLPSTLLGPSRSNVAGHWESRAIMDLNNEILASAGSSWDDWLQFNPRWFQSPKADEFRERAQEVLAAEFGSASLPLIKDPRICRFPGFWIEALQSHGVRPVAVLPLRNPLEVAASLEARNHIEPRYGQLMWLRHVLDAEQGTRGLPRCITSYEGLLKGWSRFAEKAEADLGLTWPRMSETAAAEIDAFLTRDFRHHAEAEGSVAHDLTLPDWLRQAHDILSRWARSGEDQADFAALDEIRAEMNAAAPPFARLLRAGRVAAARARELEKTAAKQAEDLRALKEALASGRQALADARKTLEAAKTAHERWKGRAQELSATLEVRNARVRKLDDDAETWKGKTHQARAELAERTQKVQELRTQLTARDGSVQQLRDKLEELKAQLRSQVSQGQAERQLRQELRQEMEKQRKQAIAKSAGAAQLLGRAMPVLALGRRWPGLGGLQARLAARRLRRSGLIDVDWYLARNKDVRESKGDPVLHYVLYGAAEGRAPHPLLSRDQA